MESGFKTSKLKGVTVIRYIKSGHTGLLIEIGSPKGFIFNKTRPFNTDIPFHTY